MVLENQPFLWLHPTSPDPACLLLHGLGGGVFEMYPLAQALHSEGFTVQGILYPGHERPTWHMPASTWQEWYGSVLQAYQQLQAQYGSVILIGLSTGCPLALHLAAAHPVAKLVLLAPFLALKASAYSPIPVETLLTWVEPWLSSMPRLSAPVQDPVMRQAATAACFSSTFNLSTVRSALELIALVKPELPRIQTPTLILQSKSDTVVDPAGAEEIYQQLGSPVKQRIWLHKSNHLLPLDVERETVFAHIKAFLR